MFTLRHFDTLADYDACVALQDDTWGHGFTERVPGAILRVAQKIGGVAAGAFDEHDRLMGFVFGMTGVQDGALVHWSDMLAVRPEARGTGLGAQLKHFQRDALLPLSVRLMIWTADPLVARNAHFNITHLGATPAAYVENMYGAHTGSVLHGALPTDRLVYHWDLPASSAWHPGDGRPCAADDALPDAIVLSPDGTPGVVDTGSALVVRVRIPHDFSAVHAAGAERALAWRLAVRHALGGRLERGDRVTHFVRGHDTSLPYYVVAAR
ncbi:MAG: hypothetical protein V4813_06995 [Gemmatimonadota bacterium]